MTNTITKTAYRMLVLAVMALLMAVNLSQTAFACLTSETSQNGTEITKNPMDCLVYDDIEARLINTCDEDVSYMFFDEDRYCVDPGRTSGLYTISGKEASAQFGCDAIRWAACFAGERIEGFDDYYDTEYHCVAE